MLEQKKLHINCSFLLSNLQVKFQFVQQNFVILKSLENLKHVL